MHDGPAESSVARAGWQSAVFAAEPSRLAVLALQPAWPLRPLPISVHRNTGVEIFTAPLAKFLTYAGFSAEFDIGDYDDSLSFASATDPALDLIWVDVARYAMPTADFSQWLTGRLAARRQAHTKPIVVGLLDRDTKSAAYLETALAEATRTLGGISICEVSRVVGELGPSFRSERTGAVTASPMSNRAAMEIARLLGFEWLPSVLLPRIKAIAVDLDGTLYRGVLGEDGPTEVAMTADFALVQERIRSYGAAGVLLVLTSKNTSADVDRLFELRSDFVLRLSDFADTQIGWTDKATSIQRAAERLRIAPDAFLLVDDNIGEIAAVAAAIPGINVLFAGDPVETARALALYPGLAGYGATQADQVRAKDLAVALTGVRPKTDDSSGTDYLRSLGVRVSLVEHPIDQIGRVHELSIKTNQFNTALARFSEAEVARRLSASDCRVFAVALKDRLSDSGVIAAIQTRIDGLELVVDEIAISCRALGRGLEDSIISAALVRSARDLGATRIRLVVRDGPRNEPARDWAATLSADRLADGSLPLAVFEARLARFRDLVDIVWTESGA